MSTSHPLSNLIGSWTGENLLWLHPEQPARESKTAATLSLVAGGRFALLHYDWADEGEPQEGLLLIGKESLDGSAMAVWVDSWHMGDQAMTLQGKVTDEGHISVLGSYAVPEGPDWGWRIVIEPGLTGSFRLLMFNILPEGQEALAVQATYARST